VTLGAVSPPRDVPAEITRPDYVQTGRPGTSRAPQIQDEASLERMRHAGHVAATVLLRTGDAVEPGITTDELDAIAHGIYIEHGAYPSTLHYNGYTKSICTSVNGVVCHGIPDDRPLAEGDIVNVDVTAYIGGVHGDTSATFIAGRANEPIEALVETTRLATLLGIAAIRPNEPTRRIAEAIEPFVRGRGYGIVQAYGGHGIGATFHAEPHVNHTVERHDTSILAPGTTITVEPMVTTGRPGYSQADDGWTEHTDDNMPSAQFEHTVVVTEDGAEILTVTETGETAVGTLADVAELPAPASR
jgi:methionyl aminopeptidase